MNIFKVMLLSSLLLATACGVQGVSGGTKPEENTGFLGSKKDDFEVDTQKAFAGKNQVVIGSFKVAFLEGKKASKKAGGGLMGSGMGGKSSAKMTLTGIDAATEQQITDAAYKDFLAQLKKNGYTVVERDALLADKDFKGVNSEKSPFREESSFFGSKVTANYFAPTGIDKIYWQGEGGRMGGFGFSNPMMGAIGYAERSGIPVLFVTYTLDFANAEGHGGWATSTSSLSVGQGLSVASGGGVSLFGGQGGTFSSANGHIKLGQPVYSTDTYGEVIDSSSDAYKGAEVALNVVGSVLGAGSNITREYEIKAKPAEYKKVAEKVLKEANEKLVGKMASFK